MSTGTTQSQQGSKVGNTSLRLVAIPPVPALPVLHDGLSASMSSQRSSNKVEDQQVGEGEGEGGSAGLSVKPSWSKTSVHTEWPIDTKYQI